MLDKIDIVKPEDIEKRSFEIISEILGDVIFPPMHEPIIKRVIHTTADFDFAKILSISEEAVESGLKAIREGSNIVTDTMMAASGINKKELNKYGGRVVCYMTDEKIAERAKACNTTRASLCMERASEDENNRIYVIGNAPTALIRLYELVKEGTISPDLIVGVPVGFVNVIESKELLKTLGIPYIITDGRKGGSNIAAAIINAILYMNRV